MFKTNIVTIFVSLTTIILVALTPPAPPAPPTPGHLELYAIYAVSPGQRTDVRVEAQGCSPAPTKYEWSLSSNARLVAGGNDTISIVFTGPDGNRGRHIGAIDVKVVGGSCAGMTAHAAPLVGVADPNLYNPALDENAQKTTVVATPGITPPPGVCLYVPSQTLFWAPGVASSGKVEVQLLGQSDGCGRGPNIPVGAIK